MRIEQQQQQLRPQSHSQPLFELEPLYHGPQTEPFSRQLEVIDDLAGRSGAEHGQRQHP
jgi:hypothetical protein